jgi:hypothetical protein
VRGFRHLRTSSSLTNEHYFGTDNIFRIEEVDKVMTQMHGGKYRWDWKKYKTAMQNMGCEWFHLWVPNKALNDVMFGVRL